MVILSKLIAKFGTIPIKVLVIFFADINEPILKFIWKCKRPIKPKNNFEKQQKQKESHLFQKLTRKLIVMKHCDSGTGKDTRINRIELESSEITFYLWLNYF